METKRKTSSSSSTMPNWSLLQDELLHIVSKKVENCFDLVHARSVCSLWRSIFPFPSYLLRPTYSLPTFNESSLENESALCTLEKVPLFLFRVLTPSVAAATLTTAEYFLGGIGQEKSNDHMEELPAPLQCSVKVEIPGSDQTLMNILDCQIISVGHQYRLIGWKPKDYRAVAFLPLEKEGRRGEFVVLLSYTNRLMVLTSSEMKWKRLDNVPEVLCSALFTFKGKFYASFMTTEIVVIDPYSLEVTLPWPSPQKPLNYMVPYGDDELLLVEVTVPEFEEINFERFTCKVSRLDEEVGKWVEVTDLEDRVLFIKRYANVSWSAKELPHGCGLSRNSFLFTDLTGYATFAYKYGVHTGNVEDDLNCWRYLRQNRVRILSSSPVVALQVEC